MDQLTLYFILLVLKRLELILLESLALKEPVVFVGTRYRYVSRYVCQNCRLSCRRYVVRFSTAVSCEVELSELRIHHETLAQVFEQAVSSLLMIVRQLR